MCASVQAQAWLHLHLCSLCFQNKNENSSAEVPSLSMGDTFKGIPRMSDSVASIKSYMCCVVFVCVYSVYICVYSDLKVYFVHKDSKR